MKRRLKENEKKRRKGRMHWRKKGRQGMKKSESVDGTMKGKECRKEDSERKKGIEWKEEGG